MDSHVMDSNKDDTASDKENDLSPTSTNKIEIARSEVHVSANTIHHHHYNITGGSSQQSEAVLSENSKLSSSPIHRFRQPISNLKDTETYQKILKKSENVSILVLLCHGIPGSGKSQIVRKLAKEFPFKNTSDQCIKWHIQCNDSGHDVKQELEELAKELRRNSYIQSDDKYQSIVRDIHNDLACSLAAVLFRCDVPVLIIIEDPGGDCKKILQDFFRCLQNGPKAETVLHVYITSRVKSVVLSDDEILGLKCVKMEHVKGFSRDEAVDYLCPDTDDDDDMKAADKVFQRFSGVPLGLQAARAHCKNSQISYTDYLELVEENEYEIQESETKKILADYGESAEHVFQALTLPFQATDEPRVNLQWKVLSCLSYFHYDRIPKLLIMGCFRHLREKVVKMVRLKEDKGQLVTKLTEHDMCTVTDKDEVTFHEVVINSFRLKAAGMQQASNFQPLKSAIIVMSGLLTKDLRKKENQTKMFQLRRHVQSLLENVEKDDKLFAGEDSFLLSALVSHLYETTAAIMSAESPVHGSTSNKYFEAALCKLWRKKEEKRLFSLIDPEQKDNTVAQYVVQESKNLATNLPDNFILKYYSKLPMPIDKEELDFLKSKSSGNFDAVLKSVTSWTDSGEVLRQLQSCGVFLPDNKLRDIFLAERMASILHSWSRVILFAEDDLACEYEKCIWFSSLSRCISRECKEMSSKSLLAERLAVTGGSIPILVRQKKNTKSLMDVIKMCEAALSEQLSDSLPPMYENGLLKEVDGPSNTSTRLIVLRSLVRSYGRLLKLNPDQSLTDKADKACEDLIKLACKHLDSKSSAIMCLICCAKYYAGKKDFDKSMDCFRQYFEECEKFKPRFNVHCWAVYNYMRAAYHGKNEAKLEDAKCKCREVLNSPEIMSQDLHKKLHDLLHDAII